MKYKERSFTLIEIVIVSILLLLVVNIVYKILNLGMVSSYSLEKYRIDKDNELFLSRMEKDLLNLSPFLGTYFQGDRYNLTFFTHDSIIRFIRHNDKNIEYGPIFKVEYIFIPELQKIVRKVYRWGSTMPQRILEETGVYKMELRYIDYNEDGNIIEREKIKGVIPYSVRCKIIKNMGERTKEYIRTIRLPIKG